MSTETSDSNNSSLAKASNKKYTSTDFMVHLLHDSGKMRPEDERKYYEKNNHSDNRSASSEDLTSYVKSDADNKKNSDSNDHGNNGNSGNSIFQKSFGNQNYKFNDENGKDEKNDKKDLPDDYDNYNELSEEGKMLKRLDMLRKLGELAQYKVKLSQNYNMNSDYFTMKYEYQLHTNIRAKQNFVNWTSSLMLNCIYGVEILNEKYNPFQLKLTGWSEQINADISNYYDIFGEIYEKYNKPGKSMSPELKLVMMLGGSALKFHLNNVAVSNRLGLQFGGPSNGIGGMPGSQPVQGQDPRILEQMRQQAMTDRIREENKKQAEVLQKKSEEQHEMAAKQMQDMLMLQQKQNEFTEKQALQRKKLEEFERMKSILEQQQQPKPQNAISSGFSSVNASMNSPVSNFMGNPPNQMNQFNQMNNSMNQMNQMNNPMNAYAQQRRVEIDQQLQAMKNNLNNIKQKSQDMRDMNAERIYSGVQQPNKKKSDGITIDTSSSASKSSRSDTSTSSSSSSSSDTSSSSTSSSSSVERSNQKSKSSKSTLSSKKNSERNNVEKSLSSRNNQSTFSKRKYKRAGITIET